jgi:hypothetical protein
MKEETRLRWASYFTGIIADTIVLRAV